MGAFCEINDNICSEKAAELFGLDVTRRYEDDSPEWNLNKKTFDNFDLRNKQYYQRTEEYEKYIKKHIAERQCTSKKEYSNGTVKVIIS